MDPLFLCQYLESIISFAEKSVPCLEFDFSGFGSFQVLIIFWSVTFLQSAFAFCKAFSGVSSPTSSVRELFSSPLLEARF